MCHSYFLGVERFKSKVCVDDIIVDELLLSSYYEERRDCKVILSDSQRDRIPTEVRVMGIGDIFQYLCGYVSAREKYCVKNVVSEVDTV